MDAFDYKYYLWFFIETGIELFVLNVRFDFRFNKQRDSVHIANILYLIRGWLVFTPRPAHHAVIRNEM